MTIETLDDIIEELCNELEVYGAHDEQHCYPDDPCRVCYSLSLKRRIMDAVEIEHKLYPPEPPAPR